LRHAIDLRAVFWAVNAPTVVAELAIDKAGASAVPAAVEIIRLSKLRRFIFGVTPAHQYSILEVLLDKKQHLK